MYAFSSYLNHLMKLKLNLDVDTRIYLECALNYSVRLYIVKRLINVQ